MTRTAKKIASRMGLLFLAASILGGCGGYARSPNGASSIETYGVIDVSVQRDSR